MAANSRFAMAVHIISLLASRRERQCSAELASSVNTNPVVVRRILAGLAKAGIVDTLEGKTGGARLLRSPDNVTLWDIYRAIGEEPLFAVHQNPVKKSCPISCGMKNALTAVFDRAESAARAELKKINVSAILDQVAG